MKRKTNKHTKILLSVVAFLLLSFSLVTVYSSVQLNLTQAFQISCLDCEGDLDSTDDIEQDISEKSLMMMSSEDFNCKVSLSQKAFFKQPNCFEIPRGFYDTPLLPPELSKG